jgi:hypothetical protein
MLFGAILLSVDSNVGICSFSSPRGLQVFVSSNPGRNKTLSSEALLIIYLSVVRHELGYCIPRWKAAIGDSIVLNSEQLGKVMEKIVA